MHSIALCVVYSFGVHLNREFIGPVIAGALTQAALTFQMSTVVSVHTVVVVYESLLLSNLPIVVAMCVRYSVK